MPDRNKTTLGEKIVTAIAVLFLVLTLIGLMAVYGIMQPSFLLWRKSEWIAPAQSGRPVLGPTISYRNQESPD